MADVDRLMRPDAVGRDGPSDQEVPGDDVLSSFPKRAGSRVIRIGVPAS